MRLWAAAAILLTATVIGLALYLAGQRAAYLRAELARLTEFQATIERANDADVSAGDPAADRDWLRERGQRGGR
jgi:hypothetical protein